MRPYPAPPGEAALIQLYTTSVTVTADRDWLASWHGTDSTETITLDLPSRKRITGPPPSWLLSSPRLMVHWLLVHGVQECKQGTVVNAKLHVPRGQDLVKGIGVVPDGAGYAAAVERGGC